ncbi:MAG: lysophospholipid acyltransferase family protein [Burkholderiales bacterium]|nr:lysophospholipid acyltransferase family protein [Burkholderiales bacterium]
MLKLFFHLAARLPLPVLHFAGTILGRLVYRFSPSWRAHLTANLAQAGYQDDATRAAALREAGKALTELPAVWLRAHADVAALVRHVDGWQHIEAAQAASTPIVFLTPHLGCFEITAQYYAYRTRADKPITVLYRRPRKAALTPLIESGRGRANMRLAAADLSGVRALIRALRQGEAAGLLPDQTPDLGEGVWAPFFGRPAYTMTLVKRLVRASGATILLAFAERLPRGRGYRLTIRPFAEPLAEDVVTATTQINAALEDLIRACPTQYLWSYDRYRQPRVVPRGATGDSGTA